MRKLPARAERAAPSGYLVFYLWAAESCGVGTLNHWLSISRAHEEPTRWKSGPDWLELKLAILELVRPLCDSAGEPAAQPQKR